MKKKTKEAGTQEVGSLYCMWGMLGAAIFSTTEMTMTVVRMNADRRMSTRPGDERTLPCRQSNSSTKESGSHPFEAQ